MRIFSIFIILVALCVSSSWATTTGSIVASPNSFKISGGGCNGATLNFTTDSYCNHVCGKSLGVKSDNNNGPKTTFTLYDYADSKTCTTSSVDSTFECPALASDGTSPTFSVKSGAVEYHITCQYSVGVTEVPAGNSADKLAVGIAIIFGVLISLLAL
ncbi:hypothetical protein ACTA71_012615 [Dictyostelium dimigraforme]